MFRGIDLYGQGVTALKKIGTVALDLAERLSLPEDALLGAAKLTVTARRKMLIENHRGILAYTDGLVEVNGKGVLLRIRGEKLLLRAMDSEMLLVTGQKIFGLDLE